MYVISSVMYNRLATLDNGGLSYAISASYHTAHCAHCLTTFGMDWHHFDEENRCVDCGYQNSPAPSDFGSVFGGGATAAAAAAGFLAGAGVIFAVLKKRKKNGKEAIE